MCQNFKLSNFEKKRTLHGTHLPKLLDKMSKYEMNPAIIVEDTEQTRFCPQRDSRSDGQGETSKPHPPPTTPPSPPPPPPPPHPL